MKKSRATITIRLELQRGGWVAPSIKFNPPIPFEDHGKFMKAYDRFRQALDRDGVQFEMPQIKTKP